VLIRIISGVSGVSPSPNSSSVTRNKSNRQPELTEPGAALSMLAETSIRFAAELHGRKGISGLDPSFKLSTFTEALEVESSDTTALADKPEAPAILTKGIVDSGTVKELFQMFVPPFLAHCDARLLP
jgi:hypothetical protein